MNEYGFEIYKNVLCPYKCKQYMERAKNGEAYAHSDLLWDIRTNNNVLSCFENIWNTKNLITGYDGIGMGRPRNLDWHTDQSFVSDTCVCVQGILALTFSNATEFVIKSHELHKDVIKEKKYDGKWQFQNIDLKKEYAIYKPTLFPGDLLVWDSRTFHKVSSKNYERVVAYLSMVPKHFASCDTLEKRIKYYNDGIATTHWPHLIINRGANNIKPSLDYDHSPTSIKNLIC